MNTFSGPKNVAFLFGSGISIPALLPKMDEITKKVLSGDGVIRGINGNYYFGRSAIEDGYVPIVTQFLNRLKNESDQYYARWDDRSVNYEDLYYIASQISDSESEEYDNPAIQPLIDKILPDIDPLLKGNGYLISEDMELRDLARETTNYIHDIVQCSLAKEPETLDHLAFIKDACLDNDFSSIDIFTLNHDAVLEQFFKAAPEIQVTDGFDSAPAPQARFWSPTLFEKKDFSVRLFKLHGSVDWYRLRPDEGSRFDDKIGIPQGDIYHSTNALKQRLISDARPMFLAGTFNKMLDYTGSIYAELYCWFLRRLNETERLIVCGYGFGDKGINRAIFEWVYASRTRRVIIIHDKPEELKEKARPILRNNWDELEKEGILKSIPQKIKKDTKWWDIKSCL